MINVPYSNKYAKLYYVLLNENGGILSVLKNIYHCFNLLVGYLYNLSTRAEYYCVNKTKDGWIDCRYLKRVNLSVYSYILLYQIEKMIG